MSKNNLMIIIECANKCNVKSIRQWVKTKMFLLLCRESFEAEVKWSKWNEERWKWKLR